MKGKQETSKICLTVKITMFTRAWDTHQERVIPPNYFVHRRRSGFWPDRYANEQCKMIVTCHRSQLWTETRYRRCFPVPANDQTTIDPLTECCVWQVQKRLCQFTFVWMKLAKSNVKNLYDVGMAWKFYNFLQPTILLGWFITTGGMFHQERGMSSMECFISSWESFEQVFAFDSLTCSWEYRTE